MFDEWSCLDRPQFDPLANGVGGGCGLGRLAGGRSPMTLVLSCDIPDRTQRPHAHGRPPSRERSSTLRIDRHRVAPVPPYPAHIESRARTVESTQAEISLQKSERTYLPAHHVLLRPSHGTMLRSICGAQACALLYTDTVPLYITSLGRTTTSDAPARMPDEYTMVSSEPRASATAELVVWWARTVSVACKITRCAG